MVKKESSPTLKEWIRWIWFSEDFRAGVTKKLSAAKYKWKKLSARQMEKILDNNYIEDKYHSVTYTYGNENEDIKLTWSMVDKMIVEVEWVSKSGISLAYAFNNINSPS